MVMTTLLLLLLAFQPGVDERIGMLNMGQAPDRIVVFTQAPGTGPKRMMRWKAEGAVEEYGYEEEGLVVFEQRNEWVRVKLKAGSAWTKVPTGGKFMPLTELLTETLVYLNSAWDGRLAKTAGAVATGNFKGERQPPVKVLGHQTVDGKLWFRISILSASPCEEDKPKVRATGWVPARMLWYYTRGC